MIITNYEGDKMSILAIGTHPDDIEIGCGGTLRKYIDAGEKVDLIIITDGRAGSDQIKPDDLTKIREDEAREAAKVLGAWSIHFLGLKDGLTSFTREKRVELVSLIRKLKPHTVFIHAQADQSPDHKVARDLSLAALAVVNGPWYEESLEKPCEVKNIYGYEVWNPLNTFGITSDITNTLQAKINALNCHKSQLKDINYSEAFMGLARYRGVMTGAGQYVEVFETINSKLEIS